MEASQFYQILNEILTLLPSLLTSSALIIVAVIRWKRHPRVSLMVVISLALMILHAILFAIVFVTVISIASYENLRMMQTYQTLVSVAYNLTLAIITAILLAAIFVQRKESPEGPASEPLARAA